jgi:GNAT superfamily N-acetyltransferase
MKTQTINMSKLIAEGKKYFDETLYEGTIEYPESVKQTILDDLIYQRVKSTTYSKIMLSDLGMAEVDSHKDHLVCWLKTTYPTPEEGLENDYVDIDYVNFTLLNVKLEEVAVLKGIEIHHHNSFDEDLKYFITAKLDEIAQSEFEMAESLPESLISSNVLFFLLSLEVKPEYQNDGIGTFLMKRIIGDYCQICLKPFPIKDSKNEEKVTQEEIKKLQKYYKRIAKNNRCKSTLYPDITGKYEYMLISTPLPF